MYFQTFKRIQKNSFFISFWNFTYHRLASRFWTELFQSCLYTSIKFCGLRYFSEVRGKKSRFSSFIMQQKSSRKLLRKRAFALCSGSPILLIFTPTSQSTSGNRSKREAVCHSAVRFCKNAVLLCVRGVRKIFSTIDVW